MAQKNVNLETAKELGVDADEFQKIQDYLGRMPNFTELSIFSVMWSEHASYKNSIIHLKRLPRDGEQILVEAGEENAGMVDIGNGQACVFKIESHNHPSAVEPFQGAATGVGGINRDIKSIADPDNPEKAELKHTPDITVGNVDENGFAEIKIVIGQKGIIHPSTDTHWIDYISLSADEKLVGKLEFEAGTASGYAAFRVKTEGVKKLTAEAGCNIHGIWKHSVNL